MDRELRKAFHDRIADHAVVIAERVRFIVSGEANPLDADTA